MTRIAVAMSGGVDSSVAALLLRRRDPAVVGLTMRLYDRGPAGRPAGGRCCAPRDVQDARAAANRIGIPFYVVDMEQEFRRDVIDDFIAEYRAGRTPVPCVRCNSGPKFRHLAARARAFGAGRVATGHYARLESGRKGRWLLRAARDRSKDQSYFLFELTQDQLSHALFPLGDLSKGEVRAIAARNGLPNAAKPESQDICFVPEGRYLDFVRREGGDAGEPGPIVDTRGRQVGRHTGLAGFTVGQRRGLGIASGRPMYVVALDASTRSVIVGEEGEQLAGGLLSGRFNWVSIPEPRAPFEATARIRSSHRGAAARVEPLPDGRVRVLFREPQRAVAPGQAVVLYSDDLLLGGGFIAAALDRAAGARDGGLTGVPAEC